MEILNYNFYPLALNIGLVISSMIVILIVIITATHWQTDRKQKCAIAFDRVNEPLLMSYIEGSIPNTITNKISIKKTPIISIL